MSNNEQLIAEARKLIANYATYNFGMHAADKLAHEVAGNLADALEQADHELAKQAATIEAVKAYADERAWYGQRNRTIGSNRIASDLLAILTSTDTPEGGAE